MIICGRLASLLYSCACHFMWHPNQPWSNCRLTKGAHSLKPISCQMQLSPGAQRCKVPGPRS